MKISNIQEIMATRSRATFSHRISFEQISYTNIDPMRDWCSKNCDGLWRCETIHAIYWQFELEQEAMMFMLRWGSANGNKLK